MNTYRPSDAFGELFTVDIPEDVQTMVDDAWDDGYELGWREAILQCVTQLLPLAVLDLDEIDDSDPED